MKKLLLALVMLGVFNIAYAKDDIIKVNIDEALHSELAKKVLNPKISLSFGTSSKKYKIIDKDLISNKKTSNIRKTPNSACTRAFLSAIKELERRAESMGATQIVNIVSYYKKDEFDDKNYFKCGVGFLMSGVTLKGDIVK